MTTSRIVMRSICGVCETENYVEYGGLSARSNDGRGIACCLACWEKALPGDRSPRIFFPSLYGRRIGRISHVLNPTFSSCFHCHTTWQYVKSVSVYMGKGFGTFMFCQACWDEVSLTEKLQAYEQHFHQYPSMWTLSHVRTCVIDAHHKNIGVTID